MVLSSREEKQLKDLCKKFRIDVIKILFKKQTGHPGGSLSVCEILTTLYFHQAKINPKDPDWPDRDRIVLCKGHAAPMLYTILSEKGYFPYNELFSLRDIDSRLQGHPCSHTTPGVDISTGPLGIGLSVALGISVGLKLNNSTARVYAIMGDGEINEGTVWEACMAAAVFKADNLCAILDWNGVQLDGRCDEIMPLGNVRDKFESFGWNCIECDGHDVKSLCMAYSEVDNTKGKPTIILAHTVKGKGVSFMEGKNIWHGRPIGPEEYERALAELKGVVHG